MTDKPRVWVSRPTFPGVIARLEPHFQVTVEETERKFSPAELAARLRQATGLHVMGVGLVVAPQTAEDYLQAGQADLVALGREALYNPNWPVHAEVALGANDNYATWPRQYRMFLIRRAAAADALRKTHATESAG